MKNFENPFIGDQVPSEVDIRLRERLEVFHRELAGKKIKNEYFPVFRFVLGGLALAGLGISLAVFFPGRGTMKGLYAAAIQDLSTKRTLAYSVKTSLLSVDVISKFPGLERKKMSGGIEMITDENQGKSLVLFHKEKVYLWESSKGALNGLDNLDVFESLPGQAEQELGRRMIDGRAVVGFRVVKKSKSGIHAQTNVWIDPVTRQLVMVEREIVSDGITSLILEIRNIKINESLDDSLFDLTPRPITS